MSRRRHTVNADIDESLAPLTPVADLAAYRLIQEALTNTMRHAPGATAHIQVRRCGDMVELLAQDDGGRTPVRPSGPSSPSGSSLGPDGG
jgi:signal transduction histidine kinase